MKRLLTANESLVSFLSQAEGPVIIQDLEGNVLGYYTPASKVSHGVDQGKCGKTAYTTREVFEHLKTLTLDPELLVDLQKHIEAIDARDKECDVPLTIDGITPGRRQAH
jgi:hypothetical protein